ncbi:serpin B4 [Trichonephila clavata]|uniref:Serpin B4 n=1 Tax=Trichonephila clavata TaxID=2740835 RepID=A0A8X6JCH1_TRICU|nr:serpin B4 [Trichonephila clavata]
MKATDEFRHAMFDDFQAFELPCNEENISMLFVLPNKRDGLKDIEDSLNHDKLLNIFQKSNDSIFSFSLPKFRMRLEMALNREIRALGLKKSLDEEVKVSGMDAEIAFIYKVIHKRFVEINENGTEASGGTY